MLLLRQPMPHPRARRRSRNPTKGAFASPGGVTSGTTCTAAVPCDLPTAIASAAALAKPYVYVGQGTYPALSITPSSAVSMPLVLVGGWTSVWLPVCDSTEAVIQTTTESQALSLSNVTGSVTFDTLSIINANSSPAAGESLYGAFALGSSVAFHNVVISVTTAGAGGSGASITTPGSNGADGGCPPEGSGAAGTGGAAAVVGSYTASGFSQAVAATANPGLMGVTGAPGTTNCVDRPKDLLGCRRALLGGYGRRCMRSSS